MKERKEEGRKEILVCLTNNYMLSFSSTLKKKKKKGPFYSLQGTRIHFLHLKPCTLTPYLICVARKQSLRDAL